MNRESFLNIHYLYWNGFFLLKKSWVHKFVKLNMKFHLYIFNNWSTYIELKLITTLRRLVKHFVKKNLIAQVVSPVKNLKRDIELKKQSVASKKLFSILKNCSLFILNTMQILLFVFSWEKMLSNFEIIFFFQISNVLCRKSSTFEIFEKHKTNLFWQRKKN